MTPLETMSRDAVYQDRFFRTRAEAGIQHLDFEKSPPPFKNYDREIGGFLAGFIPLMWWLLLVATGAWK